MLTPSAWSSEATQEALDDLAWFRARPKGYIKIWMFHGNEAGAEASCRVYSLIETGKLNGREPWAHRSELLSRLPVIREAQGNWAALLPGT